MVEDEMNIDLPPSGRKTNNLLQLCGALGDNTTTCNDMACVVFAVCVALCWRDISQISADTTCTDFVVKCCCFLIIIIVGHLQMCGFPPLRRNYCSRTRKRLFCSLHEEYAVASDWFLCCCKSFGSPQTAQIPIKYLILTLFLAFPLVKQLFTICYLWLPDFFAPGVGSKDIGELRSSKSVSWPWKHMFLLNMLRHSLQIPPLSFQKWPVTLEKCPFCTPAPGLFRYRSERLLNFSDCSVKRQAQLRDRGTVSAKVILIIFSIFFLLLTRILSLS